MGGADAAFSEIPILALIMNSSIEQEIQQSLAQIEHDEKVKIFYACESGSRAWGFASRNSDYDVRFLYLRPPEWYLAIDLELRRDVIERPITGALDVNGWDLRKALQLFRKSNPPLLEWLQSPIVYKEEYSITAQLRAELPRFYSPTASLYHYLHMARGNYRDYLRGDSVWLKKYFYVLRPLLAIKWIEADIGPVPTEFNRLLERLLPKGTLREAIDNLMTIKMAGGELDKGPRIETISSFIEKELARLEVADLEPRNPKPPWEDLNRLFRSALDELWPRDY